MDTYDFAMKLCRYCYNMDSLTEAATMKLKICESKNWYGEDFIIAENDTHILYPFLGIEWIYTTKDNYCSMISDERKNVVLRKSDGFKTIEQCVEYINKYIN